MNEPCKHMQFDSKVMINRLEDTGRFVAEVTITCVECKLPFRFMGLPIGLDLNGATVNHDSTEARLSMLPADQPMSLIDEGVTGFTVHKHTKV